MRRLSLGGSIVLCVVVTGSSACFDDPPFSGCDSGNVAASASDVVVATNDEAALYFAVAAPISELLFAAQGDQAPNAAAQVVAASTENFPGGCAQTTAAGGTVSFELHDCTGPLGLVHATGTVTAKIVDRGSNPGGLFLIQLSGDSIAANGASLILNTSAMLTVDANGGKTLRATSMTNGTGPSGTWVDHNGTFTMTWSSGSACATINATLSGVGSGSYGDASVAMTNYVACANSCPRSGLVTSIFEQGSLNLLYDGKPYAFCMPSTGASDAVALECVNPGP